MVILLLWRMAILLGYLYKVIVSHCFIIILKYCKFHLDVTLLYSYRVLLPYVLGLLIWHFDPRSTSTASEAYSYATAVVFLSLIGALVTHHSNLGLLEVGMRVRIACSSVMYRKVLYYMFITLSLLF